MKKACFSLLSAMLFTHLGLAQNTLSGTITSSAENKPLEQVNLYIPHLEKGTVTSQDGSYILNNLPSGTYKIVVSLLGFLTHSKTIEIKEGANILNIDLVGSAIEMEEVIVSTPFHKLQSENVMKVEYANIAELQTKGAVTLADGITTIPGVEIVSTGLGIGKPVIRGLSSNRVLVYNQGIRMENQQFGDEHGLGLSDAGIASVEVIKGPASLLYGSDALGGVLYLNPEKFAIPNSTRGDININYFSNTEGIKANVGLQTSSEKFKLLVRGSSSSHIDYEAGDETRVTNSRFNEYDLKTGVAYQGTMFKTELRYNFNSANLGIAEELGEQTKTRSPERPNQKIDNHILSSKTNVFFSNSSLEVTLGYIFNERKEFEENEEGAALHMDLATFNYNLHYKLPKWGKFETIIGTQGMYQTNTNFGEELLIPDAITNDFGLLATSHVHFNENNDLQLGLRYDTRNLNAEENGAPNEENYIASLNKSFSSLNMALGYKLNFSSTVVGRLNMASGFRAPNLAELTSNGVHEGTNRFEIGNANLENEQNFQTDFALEYKNEHFEFFVNGFYNSITNYVFLAPTGEVQGEDAVFLYEQQDAELYGGEIGFHIHPHPFDWLHIESSYQSVTGKLNNGEYLPLIPANSITNTLRIEFNEAHNGLLSSYAFISMISVFDQNNVSDFETVSNGYSLLNIGLGATVMVFNKEMDVKLNGRNILDKSYVSHLSRLKTDGISNIGRNITLGISFLL